MDDPPQPRRGLLLDLDGTIADTLPLVFEAFRHAVAPWVVRPPTDAEVEATFGPNERACLARMVADDGLDEAERRYHDYYESRLGDRVAIVAGLSGAIDRARELGWRVGVFTGKGRRSAEFTLAELGLSDRVEHLVSSDDVARPKPDPEGVHTSAAALSIPVDRILLAGDTPGDVQAGRSAGSKTAAVLWAAFQPDRLRNLGADFVCDEVADLVAAINTLHAQG